MDSLFLGSCVLVILAICSGPWWVRGELESHLKQDESIRPPPVLGLIGEFMWEISSHIPLPQGWLRGRLEYFLEMVGASRRWSPEFLVVTLLFISLASLAGELVFLAGYSLTPSLVGGMGSFALVMGGLPLLWLYEQGEQRRREIEDDFPLALEFLAMFLVSGMGLIQALERVEVLCGKSLSEELHLTLRDIRLGLPREVAWLHLTERISSPSITSTLAGISDGDRQGTPLAGYCRKQSELLRFQRLQRMEKGAGEAPVRLLLPMGLVCVSCLLLLGGALYLRAGGGILL